jgi:hypothetical protein
MMWIDGINPTSLFRSYMAAVIALIVCGVPAALQQQHYSPILKYSIPSARVDWPRVLIVTTILFIPIVAHLGEHTAALAHQGSPGDWHGCLGGNLGDRAHSPARLAATAHQF